MAWSPASESARDPRETHEPRYSPFSTSEIITLLSLHFKIRNVRICTQIYVPIYIYITALRVEVFNVFVEIHTFIAAYFEI